MIQVKIKTFSSDVILPEIQTSGSAGYDIRAYISESTIISPGECVVIGTGLAVEIPEGYDIEIRPRSGLSTKHLILIPNSPGTIDSDYRGEIKVPLLNLSKVPFAVENGMRIAQMLIRKNEKIDWQLVTHLNETEGRGQGGFGSTGI